VVFSFFRKNPKDAPQAKPHAPSASSRPQVAPAARPVSPTTSVTLAPQPVIAPEPAVVPPSSPPPQPDMKGVRGGGAANTAEMYSMVEEAAILYASGYPDQAAALLRDFIRNHADSKVIQPWMMLFDIYQTQNMKPQFEELELEFVVRFERSAPIWSNAKVPGVKVDKPKAGGAATEGYVALTGMLQGNKDSFFQGLIQTAQKSAGLRLDFARLEGLDASASRRLAETLQSLKKSGKKITPISASHATDLLKGLLGQGGEDEQAHWQLLFDLYQYQGMQAEFEDLAVEYAIAFEMSPPSWETVPLYRHPVAVVTVDAPDELPHDEDTFFMSGLISTDSAQQLQELKNFAASRSEIYLDMADVSRVDFTSIGSFVSVLVGLNCGGKKLRVRNANEMIRALFGVMGVDQFVDILKRRIG